MYDDELGEAEDERDDEQNEAEAERQEAAQEEWSEYLEWQRSLGATN